MLRWCRAVPGWPAAYLLPTQHMTTPVDIAFDCLPLRSVGRIDVPLDASPALQTRYERLQRALDTIGTHHSYFLYNTRCVFRLANSDVENMLRFTFDGTLLTDQGDAKADRALLDVQLVAHTCPPVPPAAMDWFSQIVHRAVLIEFDRFISAGKLAARLDALGSAAQIAHLSDFSGMNV